MTTANEPRTLTYDEAAAWMAEHVLGWVKRVASWDEDELLYWQTREATDIVDEKLGTIFALRTQCLVDKWRPFDDLNQAAMLALRLKGVHWELSAGGAFLTGGVVKACAFMPTSYTPEGLARALFLACCQAALPAGWRVEDPLTDPD